MPYRFVAFRLGMGQLPSPESVLCLARPSAGNSDAIPTLLSMVSTAVEGRTLWPGNAVISLYQTMLFTRWSHTFRTSSGRRFPLTLHLKSSVAVCTWNSVYLSARIRYISISCRRDRLAGSYISNFLIGENVTGTMPKTSNQALFPTVLVLSIAQLKPSLNRSLATSKLTLFLAKTRSHSC